MRYLAKDGLPKKVALCGFPGSGKDTLAEQLKAAFGYQVRSFADPLKRMLLQIDPVYQNSLELLEKFKREDLHGTREKLQKLGMIIRGVKAHYFVEKAYEGVEEGHVVFPDARFANEVEYADLVVFVSRPGHGAVNDHVSEKNTKAMMDGADLVIQNSGTPEDMLVSFVTHLFN